LFLTAPGSNVDAYITKFNQCVGLGWEDVTYKIDVLVYPNPAYNILNVSHIIDGNCVYEIVDMTGKVLISGRLNEDLMQTTIQIGPLESGVYFIRFRNKETFSSLKFVKI
jgi:hypothetical protein